MGTIKDRNGMDLTEAEDIKKMWPEYTELYKKDLHDSDNHDGMITHLEPDKLECEVQWVLGSITTNKVSGGNKIPVELFQILKDDAVKVLHSVCQQIWNSAMASSIQFSCSLVSSSSLLHGSQHARPPCPSPTSRVYSNYVH